MSLTTSESPEALAQAPAKQFTIEPETPQEPIHQLPERPLFVIEPSSSLFSLRLKELWEYRELFYFLIWRDIKVRYKQTLLGTAWAIIQPLFTMLIFTLFFGRLAGVPSDGIPYPIFAYAGLLPWTFFANALTNGSRSLVGNSNMITKVYFPRMLVPSAAVGAGVVDFFIAGVLLVGLMLYYKVTLTLHLLMLLPISLLTFVLATGIALWLSALYVKYRDIQHVLPFMVQLWMFVSPVIYPLSLVPEKWRWLFSLNPMAGLIENFRAGIFGRPFAWTSLALSAVITFAFLLFSVYAFRRMERKFADII